MMFILYLWTFFRLLTSAFTTYVSSIHPITTLELSTSVIPSSLFDCQWLERVFLLPWLRWDVVWYQRIVEDGYTTGNGTAQFHPLYPWLASLIHSIGLNPILSLLIISSGASLVFLFIYFRLAKLDLSESDARFSLLLILIAPPAFILFAPYPESLFLLCTVVSIYLARRGNWWFAGLAGGIATLTRQQGIFLLFPLAYEFWEAMGKSWVGVKAGRLKLLSLAIIPLSYAFWICYRAYSLGDIPFKFSSLHDLIYSLFISPSAVEVVPQQTFTWPWTVVWLSINKAIKEPDVDIWINLILALIFLIILGITWSRMRVGYRLYSLVITLVSFSYYTGQHHPLMGLPRHLFLAFPVYLISSPLINRPILRPLFLILHGIVYLLLLFLFSREAWIV